MRKRYRRNKGMSNLIILFIVTSICLFFIIIALGNDLKESKEEIEQIKLEYQNKIDRSSIIDYSPTLEEVKNVLEETDIEDIPFDGENFNCYDYSIELIKAFRDRKIYSCLQILYFADGGGHAIVVVNTSDYGLIHIEPQDDEILYSLEVGEDYCDKLNWYCQNENWTITSLRNCYK